MLDNNNLEKQNETFRYQSNTYTVHFLDDNDTEFLVLHKMAYKIIQEWAVEHMQMDNTWMQWRKWTLAGLKALQPTQQIKKILQVSNIFDYVKHMNKFPVFQKAFDITENTDLSEIQYHYLFGAVSKGQNNHINSAKYDFDHFMNVFHVKTYNMQN